jgi:hypothetical protein
VVGPATEKPQARGAVIDVGKGRDPVTRITLSSLAVAAALAMVAGSSVPADAAKVKQRGKSTNAPSADWSKFIRIESMTKGTKAKGLKSKK